MDKSSLVKFNNKIHIHVCIIQSDRKKTSVLSFFQNSVSFEKVSSFLMGGCQFSQSGGTYPSSFYQLLINP